MRYNIVKAKNKIKKIKKIKREKGSVTTYNEEIKKIKRDQYEQLYHPAYLTYMQNTS